jgi:hypothetical protein
MIMERGKPDLRVYTFEVPSDSGRDLDYPDSELWTLDYQEADAYAQKKGYLLIANEYEWQDSELLEDYTPAITCRYCGIVIVREESGPYADPDYEDTDNRRYCDESPDHTHAPDQD